MDFFELLEKRRSVRNFEDKEILTELAIPENYKIVAPIILGYPKQVPSMPPRKEPRFLKLIA